MDIFDVIAVYKIKKAPSDVYYIPNFISMEEEDDLINKVYGAPKPKWTCLSNRRLQDYGGVPHKRGMIPEVIPHWLHKYMNRIKNLGIFQDMAPNQVLVNEYLPGQGIMPHTDGPLFYPMVTTISCGSHTILNFFENNVRRDKICNFLLERRSLIIITSDMYSKYLHSIEEKRIDTLTDDCVNLQSCSKKYNIGDELERQTRISVTIRNVPKILKIKIST